MMGARKGRSVKPNERTTYDACHQLMRDGSIYLWNIDERTGLWSVQVEAGTWELRDVPMSAVADFLGLTVRKPSPVAVLRDRVAVLEAALAAAGVGIPAAVAA